MKWYETPIEDLYESALLALARNDEDAYKENIKHAYILIRQREFQTISIPDGARVTDYYQGLDNLLHMEQSKLRVMTDDILMISLIGLNLDCYATSKANCFRGIEHRVPLVALYKQAIKKILAEMDRRTCVYGLGAGYWK